MTTFIIAGSFLVYEASDHVGDEESCSTTIGQCKLDAGSTIIGIGVVLLQYEVGFVDIGDVFEVVDDFDDSRLVVGGIRIKVRHHEVTGTCVFTSRTLCNLLVEEDVACLTWSPNYAVGREVLRLFGSAIDGVEESEIVEEADITITTNDSTYAAGVAHVLFDLVLHQLHVSNVRLDDGGGVVTLVVIVVDNTVGCDIVPCTRTRFNRLGEAMDGMATGRKRTVAMEGLFNKGAGVAVNVEAYCEIVGCTSTDVVEDNADVVVPRRT